MTTEKWSQPVTVICYDRSEEYKTRLEAFDAYSDCAYNSDGCEFIRYANVCFNLMFTDRDEVTDELVPATVPMSEVF